MAIGNTKLDVLIRRLGSLSESEAWIRTFDAATKQQIIDWIQKDQLTDKGVDGFGEIIGRYSYATQVISKGRKLYGEPFDLFDEGDFYGSMFVSVFKNEIVIDANSASFTEMKEQDWYKDSILKLTDENFEKLKEIVRNSYLGYIRKTLGIG